jgi:fluoride ion exporter CrcB/FEX
MHTVFWSYFFVALGGALGAMARFALNVFMQRDVAFPWGTLGANLLGCLVMGMLAYLIAHSTWFNEAGMLQRNELFYSFTYLFATLVGGFVCFYVGFAILRSLRVAL